MIARAGQRGRGSGTWSTTYALPFAPLDALAQSWKPNDPTGLHGPTHQFYTLSDRLTETQQRAFYRARRQGWVSEYIADELACALGYHVSELWPDLWDWSGG